MCVEKPLTHTISDARLLRDEAKRTGVVTQKGQHSHSNEGCRRLCEYIWAGAIGQVHEVHCWTSPGSTGQVISRLEVCTRWAYYALVSMDVG